LCAESHLGARTYNKASIATSPFVVISLLLQADGSFIYSFNLIRSLPNAFKSENEEELYTIKMKNGEDVSVMKHQRMAKNAKGNGGGRRLKLTQVSVLLVLIGAIFIAGCITPETEQGFTEAKSREIARVFVEHSPTYQFDGFELEYNQTIVLRCPYCWLFVFDFQSRHAGYGNRTGQVLAQVITPHTAEVTVINGTITRAVLDERWDMLTQSHLPGSKLTRDEALAIARNSTCVQEGMLTDTYVYNDYTRTWWIDLEPFTEKPGCNPACVVSEDTQTAEINWRCTGALPPEPETKNETCGTETGESMSASEALQIAAASACGTVGTLTTNYSCNPNTGTWWIDLDPYETKKGCNPACVVNITTKTAEVNWRCTGLLLPE
jgi:hypothetical protein